MISVILVDDHPLFCEGVRSRFSLCDEIDLVAEAYNGMDALAEVERLRPDIVLVDINMPKMNGMDFLEILIEKEWSTKCIILSMHDDREYIMRAVSLGAYGYILKDAPGDEIITAIQTVYDGGKHFSAEVMEVLSRQGNKAKNVLTNREQLILRMISKGYSNKAIAQELKNSVRTVETHRRNISKKLNIHTTSGLVRYAIEYGIDK